jgi:hypothetical protein
MMTRVSVTQPPRLAVWLVNLFTPFEQSESIPGDLLEEFSDLSSKSGVPSARRWYWRQSAKTVAQLIRSGFRVAPWLTAGATVGGYLLGWALYYLSEKAVIAVLYKYQVYAHVDPYVFWLIYAVLVERLLEPMLVGFVVARVAKGREMIATTTLGLLCGGISGVFLIRAVNYFGWDTPNVSVITQPLILSTFVSPVLLVIGGVIARRSKLARRPSITTC